MIVKEYINENTKIRIHNDFCSGKEKNKEINEIIISLFVNSINKDVKKSCKE